MSKKIYRNIVLVAMLVMVISCALISGVMYDFLSDQVRTELRDSAQYMGKAMDALDSDIAYLESLRVTDVRITLIAANGRVLYDSVADPATMGNHLDRPEVIDAMTNQAGESTRHSDTLLERTHYYALLLSDGSVLRLSTNQKSVWSMLMSMLQAFVVTIFIVLILSFILANRLSRRIVRPINSLDLDDPMSNDVYEELSPLLLKISHQNDEIARKVAELEKQNEDFRAVSDNMSEGLVLINSKGGILSANKSAQRLFRTDSEDVEGRDILVLSRKMEFQRAVDDVLAGKASEQVMEIRGRKISLLASPVLHGREVTGGVLLLLDVTEKAEAEQLRREFSANVSHELKTPLQTISGYAEIIKDGLVKKEDNQRFVKKIYDESKRLIDLVDDIMKLSQLDEGSVALDREKIDLTALCKDVAERLLPKAEAERVALTVTGQPAEVYGIPQILDEIVYNLIDNAIKYNKENGTVDVSVSQAEGIVELTVADSGIGIPEESQARVFERFYRVDKSRSRDAGGTGLGLSIVKHGAALLGAEIDVDSREGMGTKVAIRFPQIEE